MSKTLIIIVSVIVIGGIAVFGWLYMQANAQLQRAEQQQQQEQQAQSMGETEEQEAMSENETDRTNQEAGRVQEEKEQSGMDERRMAENVTESSVIISPETLPTGSSEVTVTLEGADGISGFNIAVEAGDGVSIDSYADDFTAAGTEEEFEEVLTFISDDNTTAKLSYITLGLEDRELPSTIAFSFNVTSEGEGGEIRIEPTESEMVGPEGVQYVIE
jgi:uncharacterized protein YxeA